MKAQKFSLLGALAAALLFSAAFVPQANAFVVVYYNFEDSTPGGPVDFTSAGDVGLQFPVAAFVPPYSASNIASITSNTGTGLPANVAPGDLDPNHLAVGLSKGKANNGVCFEFTVNTFQLTQMSLSFAYNIAGNGFSTVTFEYSLNGTTFTTIGSPQTLLTSGTHIAQSATVPMAAENQASVTFAICFSGATSNGTDLQTIIDNVRLDAAPEPATVMSGLLSACGLCWVQRRRLIRLVRLRRT
jgi:hypothetical protein